jgi:hypothetical protein
MTTSGSLLGDDGSEECEEPLSEIVCTEPEGEGIKSKDSG